MESIINQFNTTQSPITALSSSGGSSRTPEKKRETKSPLHKDENDEMLSNLIKDDILDKDSEMDIKSHTEGRHTVVRPLSHTSPSSSVCKWSSATINGSKSATPKSHGSHSSHRSRDKSCDKKDERTSDVASSFTSKHRRSSHSSDGSISHKSHASENRTPQKDTKCSTPNSKSKRRRDSNFKSPAGFTGTLSESDNSDVDIESVTPHKEAIPQNLLEEVTSERSEVTKRLSFDAKREHKVSSDLPENKSKIESVQKSDKSKSLSKSTVKSKERTKDNKPHRRKSSVESSDAKQKRTPSASENRRSLSAITDVNVSIEKDMRNIFNDIGSENLSLLSPIPNIPEKSNVFTSSSKRTESKQRKVPDCLTYKNGKPSLVVKLSLSLLPKSLLTKPCDPVLSPLKESKPDNSVISRLQCDLPDQPVVKRELISKSDAILPQPVGNVSDNDNTTEYGDSDMDVDSPDSTFRIETSDPPECSAARRDYIPPECSAVRRNCIPPECSAARRDYIPPERDMSSLHNRLSAANVHSSPSPNLSPYHNRKSTKRKQDSDRSEDIKRAKPANHKAGIFSPQVE